MSLDSACAAWSRVLQPEQIVIAPPPSEGTSLAGTHPSAILYPISTEQVVEIVHIARAERVPLHAISRGRNWGYGDASPPTQGQALLDLSRMNRILEVNERLGYAIIEPGVSQGQLWERLKDTKLWMDATGAGPEASLVGNTADRGFGHTRYGDHFQTACGLEVVLGDGRILRTGFGHYEGARARWVYKYGVGPVLDGIFSQSNFGIITQLGIWLMPAPEAFCAFFFSAPEESDLERVIDELAPLKLAGLLPSAVHLANDIRALSGKMGYPWERAQGATPLPDGLRRALRDENKIGAWNACGTLTGPPEVVRATKRRLRRALGRYHLIFLDDRKLALGGRVVGALRHLGLGRGLANQLEIVRPVYRMLKGEPVSEPLGGASWRVRDRAKLSSAQLSDPAAAGAGLLWVSPVLPMTGRDARELMAILQPIYLRHGFETLVTFTLLTDRALACVTNVAFDRRVPEECASAKACYTELIEEMGKAGFIPYRTGPLGFPKLSQGSTVFWEVVAQLKNALDPAGVFSPGRYEPGRKT